MARRKAIPTAVLQQAKRAVEAHEAPRPARPKPNPVKQKLISSLKRLHPMD